MKGNMHYSVWLGLTLLLCLAGCSKETAEAPDTLLTDIYRPVIESRMGSYNTVTAFTESENGYVCAYGYFIRPSEIGQAAVQGTKLIFTDEAGNVTEEQELTADRSLNSSAIGEKGVYGAPLDIENGTYMLTWYGWDGSIVAETSLSEIKPSGASGNVPKAGYYEEMPIAETRTALRWSGERNVFSLTKPFRKQEKSNFPAPETMCFMRILSSGSPARRKIPAH